MVAQVLLKWGDLVLFDFIFLLFGGFAGWVITALTSSRFLGCEEVLVFLLEVAEGVFLKLEVLVDFGDVVSHVQSLAGGFGFQLLKGFFFVLEYAYLKQVVIFEVVQIVDHFFGRLEGNDVIVVAVICVEVDIGGPFVLLSLLVFN